MLILRCGVKPDCNSRNQQEMDSALLRGVSVMSRKKYIKRYCLDSGNNLKVNTMKDHNETKVND